MALKPGQIKCINTLEEPLVVAAGAGSGKTFTLTKRIVNALTSGYVNDIDQILAITFTKKAAGELKSRVKSSLRDAGMIDQALKVDEAWISTIHGMCSRILRSYAVELGIDPSFTVADDAQLGELRKQAVEKTLAEMRESSPKEIKALFSEYQASSFGSGFGASSVDDMVARIVEKISTYGADAVLSPQGNAISPAAVLNDAVAVLDMIAALADAQKDSASKEKFLNQIQDASNEFNRLLNEKAPEAYDVLQALGKVPTSCAFGRADFKTAVREQFDEMAVYAASLRIVAAQPLLETLLSIARQAEEILRKEKQHAGVLSNDDLLAFASTAIAEHPDIAAALENKFKLIMIDEFQDTDQSQVDMIKRLAGPDASRLCVVGDAQQSIYRFRGADVAVYRRHLSHVQSKNSDNIVKLPDNFRSHRDVLSFVDRIFERDNMFGHEFMSLNPSRDEEAVKRPFLGGGERIVVRHVSYSSRGGTDQMRLASAQAIAEEFSRLAKEGHSAGDMVILLGAMTHADVYAAAVREAGLSCVIAGGSVLKSAPETFVVIALLKWLTNPTCEEALFNVLSSSLFGLTADDFIDIATVRGKNGAYKRRDLHDGIYMLGKSLLDAGGAFGVNNDALSPRLHQALAVIQRAKVRVGVSPLRSIVNDILVESGWISRMQQLGEEGRASVANMYKLVRLVGDAETDCVQGSATLAEQFTSKITNAVEAPGALSVSGGNFVRIMTIHASKGLEFPIVAVAELRSTSVDSAPLLLDSIDGCLYASLDLSKSIADVKGPVANISKALDIAAGDDFLSEDEIPAKIKACDDALELRALMRKRALLGESEEAKRLLYVALTRAKESLIVATFGNRTKDNPNGAPKNVLSSIGPALTKTDDWFAPGVTFCNFEGTALARVQHTALEKDETPQQSMSASDKKPVDFAIPVDKARSDLNDIVFSRSREGIFSYSAVSDASHQGNFLQNLAKKYFVETNIPTGEGIVCDEVVPAFTADDWLGDIAPADDRATNFGTAFHLLAQYAVSMRNPGENLTFLPKARIDAIAQQCGIDQISQLRLNEALRTWFESDLAHDVAFDANLFAEVPFFVDIIDADQNKIFLEGEIDLLAVNPANPKGLARVVDYKTGGSSSETDQDVMQKHVLQASCYAYALLRAGYGAVEATFVRVEQRLPEGQPQIMRYRYEASDQEDLAQAIAYAYHLAHK